MTPLMQMTSCGKKMIPRPHHVHTPPMPRTQNKTNCLVFLQALLESNHVHAQATGAVTTTTHGPGKAVRYDASRTVVRGLVGAHESDSHVSAVESQTCSTAVQLHTPTL